MATGSVNRVNGIHRKTVTGTTASNGSLNLNVSSNSGNYVVNAVAVDADAIKIAKLVRATSGSQWVYVQNALTGAAVANTNVTIDVFYVTL